jgi:hypothetical protein
MRALKHSLLLLTTLVCFATVHAQTVEDILNKHQEAMGGNDKLAQLKSVHMEMSTQIMGNEAPASVTIVEGKGFKSESEAMGQKIVQVVTDKGGWMINPMTGATTAQAMPDEQYKQAADQIYATGPLYNYQEKGNTIELQGQEKVGDVNAYKLKITTKGGSEITFYIDPATYYIIEAVKTGEMMGNPVTITVTNSDFQKTPEGYVFPRSIQTSLGDQFSFTSKVTKVDINPTVDTTIFDMPK